MAESQFLSVIRIWAAVAWADGVIADAESAALSRLIQGADLSDDERATAMGWLASRVELDTANIASLSDDARKGVYRAAARMAAVDLDVAETELAFLVRLRAALGISEDVAREVESAIPGLAK